VRAKREANVAETNRQLKLQSRPKGLLAPGDLQLEQTPLASLTDGQALARVKYLSIDPTMRVWMAADSYLPAVAIGEVMRAFGFAEIVESSQKEFKKGDKVVGLTGLQDYCVIDAADKRGSFQKIPAIPFLSDTAFLGVLGVTGITAYFGMMDIAKPQKGER
jgi:NADPH-dependent curcumin reductase CurA